MREYGGYKDEIKDIEIVSNPEINPNPEIDSEIGLEIDDQSAKAQLPKLKTRKRKLGIKHENTSSARNLIANYFSDNCKFNPLLWPYYQDVSLLSEFNTTTTNMAKSMNRK